MVDVVLVCWGMGVGPGGNEVEHSSGQQHTYFTRKMMSCKIGYTCTCICTYMWGGG